jgi:hypothetical protein
MQEGIPMNSRERVAALLERKQADRYPIDIGSTYTTGIHLLAYEQLIKTLNLPKRKIRCNDVMQQLAEIDDDVLDVLGADFKQLSATSVIDEWHEYELFPGHKFLYPGKLNLKRETERWVLTDAANNHYFLPDGSYYFDSEDINCWYSTPFEATPENLSRLQRRAKQLFDDTSFALVANFGGGFMSMAPDFLMDLMLEPEKINAELTERCTKLIELYSSIHQYIGQYTCAIALYSDFGTQNGPALSPDTFRSAMKPHFKRFCDWIHSNTQWKIFLHSCGGIEPLLTDIIEMGIDALNPVQTSAAGMSPELLKKKYGEKIIFWGGACDTQHVLGKVGGAELVSHVAERIKIFSQNGGFVFNPVHDIQPNITGQDIAAIYHTALNRIT